jgi:5-methylcytosine-specific restriction enzyme A
MKRHEFTAKIKLAAWDRCKGHCETCHAKIIGGAEYDHVIPCGLGGEATLENVECLCSKCHRIKTSTQDIPNIAKAKRRERKAKGAWKPKVLIKSRRFNPPKFDNTKYINRDE